MNHNRKENKLANLIPGPSSTEMTMHCGQERAGPLMGLILQAG